MRNPSLEAIRGVFTRLYALIDIAKEQSSNGLGQLFAHTLPPLAGMYKFNIPLSPDELKSADQLLPALNLVRTVDNRRFSGPTPPSAEVPLEVYFNAADWSSISRSNSSSVSPGEISPRSSSLEVSPRISPRKLAEVGASPSRLLEIFALSALNIVSG